MSKLGPHGILTTDAGLAWARRAPIVKQLDRTNLLRAARQHIPVIYRRFWHDQKQVLRLGGSWAALAVVAGLQGFRHPNLYVEGMCETCQRLGDGLEEHVEWTKQFVAECHRHGVKVAGFAFSTGNPEPEDMLYLQKHNFAGVDALSIHEYWGNQGFTKHHALRHREMHRYLNGQHPPIMITECGRDRVEGGKGGWQLDGVSEEKYLSELREYDALLQADTYVIGATPFTSGPTGDWWAFDMDGLSDRMEGGDPVQDQALLCELFPELYKQWTELGGDPEGAFRNHLLGIGVLSATPEAFTALCEQAKSLAEQVKQVGLRLPKA